MIESHWWFSLGGGMLIGLSALLLMLFTGRIAGISGIFAAALQSRLGWRWLFLLGLMFGGPMAFALGLARLPDFAALPGWPTVLLAGLLVGIGTRLGNGCTSGHGICGMGRLSLRSLVATLVFMTTGVLTVFVTLHLL
ncbi:YeeE/YedE family protein [Aeromonas sobria]|uniref:YeeE/YedE family protein n=1 Tax=Aeromonas sobria TaxID=646 RepID=UPI003D045FCC